MGLVTQRKILLFQIPKNKFNKPLMKYQIEIDVPLIKKGHYILDITTKKTFPKIF